jgi:tRNA 2-selenouridine synthase SelU
MKTKLFNTMLEVVSEVCEVPAQEIVSTKKDEEVSDARIILVWLCSRGGLRPKEIAKFLNRKAPNFVSECRTKYTVRDA